MERNTQTVSVTNWFTLLVTAGIGAALARYSNSSAGLVAAALLGLGFLVAIVSWFQSRLEQREAVERLEFEELKKARGSATLFTEAGGDTFAGQRAREQFEKYLVPAFTVLLCVLQGGGAWWFWKQTESAALLRVDRATIAMALYALVALILFLLGKYSAGLARIENQRLLRPAAGYLMLGALVCFLVAAAAGAAWFGFTSADRWLAAALCVVLGLSAIETLTGLLFEIYRPRVKGRRMRLLYESRLIGLMGQPGGLITTAAQALDYQFGFKVSETWFYRFLEKALAWIILLQLLVLFASTMIVIVEPGEQGVLERFGRPVPGRAVLEPGLHFKWPWPVDSVQRHATREIQSFIVGVVVDADLEKETTLLWTRPHYKEEFNMLVASRDQMSRTEGRGSEKSVPANLLTVSIPIQYQISRLEDWAYNYQSARSVLENLAYSEVTRYLVSVSMEDIMSSGRQAAAETIRNRVQQRADHLKLGVKIVFVGLQDIHPPVGNKTVRVAEAYEAVVGAMQQKQTNILAALAYEAQRLPMAQAEATNLLAQARSQAVTKVALTEAEAGQFANQMTAYQASPAAYMQRIYLDTLVRSISAVRKYIIGVADTDDVILLNLEDKIREDLLSGAILPPASPPPGGTSR